jgi:1-acyl-sn-glycerol-3-phosphate acyltransferase
MQVNDTYQVPLRFKVLRPLLKRLFRGVFYLLGGVKIVGQDNIPYGTPYVVATNHVSIFDPPFVAAFWPEELEIIGANDVFSKPGQGQLLKLYGVIPVRRGEYDRALLTRIIRIIKAGFPLLIAPEGGRSHVTAMRRAKPGIAYIIEQTGVPVLPVGIIGTTHDYWKRARRGERPLLEMRIGGLIHLPEISARGVEKHQERQKNADLVMSYLAGLLPEEYRGEYAESAILPPKPVSNVWRPELVALPRLTFTRRLFRAILRGLTKLLTLITLRAQITGLENFPKQGPAVIVFNHLGEADAVLLTATLPFKRIEGIGKIELNDHWLVGPLFRAYGIIWVHRGRPDRRSLRAALDGLAEGRMVVLAPEGRKTVIGGLEDGNEGAAFLALKSGAPIVPIALTGTETENVYGHMKRWERTPVTLSVGKPFVLSPQKKRAATEPLPTAREGLQEATRQIMKSLADLLPEAYRGKFRSTPAE